MPVAVRRRVGIPNPPPPSNVCTSAPESINLGAREMTNCITKASRKKERRRRRRDRRIIEFRHAVVDVSKNGPRLTATDQKRAR